MAAGHRTEQLQLRYNNEDIAIERERGALPVKNIASWNSLPSVHILDGAVWEDRVPHVNVVDFTDIALLGVKVTQVTVWVLPQDNLASLSDGVTLLVDFGHAFPPVHEDICCSRAGVPGGAQVGLQGTKRRNQEKHSLSTQVERDSAATNLRK